MGRQLKVARQHEDALIQMGYFERRTYTFTNEYPQGFVDAVRLGPLKDPLCFFEFGPNNSVEIVAHRNDFPRIKKMLEEYRGLSPYE
jgi:hypothetical protein